MEEFIGYILIGLSAAYIGLNITAAVTDIRALIIPNWISLAIMGLFAIRTLSGLPDVDWAAAGIDVGVFAGVLAVGLVIFALNIMGGGDVKLLSVGALWFGVSHALPFVVAVAMAGGVLAFCAIMMRILRGPIMAVGLPLPGGLLSMMTAEKNPPIPYGIAIAVGAAGVEIGRLYPNVASNILTLGLM